MESGAEFHTTWCGQVTGPVEHYGNTVVALIQKIRINGTVVGGLVGVLIHAVSVGLGLNRALPSQDRACGRP